MICRADAKKWLILLFSCLTGILSAKGQLHDISAIKVSYDTSSVPELFTTIPIGVTLIFSNGETISTRGWLHGRLHWNHLNISTDQGIIRNGQLTFDREKVWDNGHRVTFNVALPDTTFTSNLQLPHVERLRFNLYTDSLKRDNPFYLNVEGRFSSGRIYPLDTQMVAFSKTGGGTLEGNVVTVAGKDVQTRAVNITTWLKTDPSLRDSVCVPVKIVPDSATLPSEQQLFDKWKKRKR